jgi:hypothetical protein
MLSRVRDRASAGAVLPAERLRNARCTPAVAACALWEQRLGTTARDHFRERINLGVNRVIGGSFHSAQTHAGAEILRSARLSYNQALVGSIAVRLLKPDQVLTEFISRVITMSTALSLLAGNSRIARYRANPEQRGCAAARNSFTILTGVAT